MKYNDGHIMAEYNDDLEGLTQDDINSIIDAGPEVFCDYDTRRRSCSFTGHRVLSSKEIHELLPKLRSTVMYLVSQGVTEFHAGGAEGFDTLAAGVVHEISMSRKEIRLVLELPYEKTFSHLKKNAREKRFYDFIKEVADQVNVHGEKPSCKHDAVKYLYKRNRVLMDKSYYCVCFLKEETGGTAYTVNYAKNLDCEIINLALQ